MAQNEHRMVFDIRGRRRHVVKFVYAILAILMAASLFLVTGAINLNSIFGGGTTGESAASSFEKQAERIETKLAKTPGDEDLMVNLTRTRINAANSMITEGVESQDEVEEVKQQLALASQGWSEYIATTDEPSPGLAIQASQALFQLAEISPKGTEQLENIEAAAAAEEIVAESRNDLNSWSTLSLYALYAQNPKLAEEAKEKAIKLAGTKFERENFENQYEEVEKNAKAFGKELKVEKAASSGGGSAGKESLENPLQSLGGGILNSGG
jgi:hypothetical protein